ncbi:MAG: hypothetical protein RLZZ546_376 [Bacteroidota bacterium]|jgi:preprotein translocase subunit YajC
MNLFILQAVGSNIMSILMMLILFTIMYFFFLRPQIKKQKEQANFQTQIKKGDEVVTTSGIIGQINKIDDSEVTLQVDKNVFMRIVKGAISKEMTEVYNKNKVIS